MSLKIMIIYYELKNLNHYDNISILNIVTGSHLTNYCVALIITTICSFLTILFIVVAS